MPRIGLNHVMLVGQVASEPRYKITSGKQLPRLWFRVQTTERYRDENGGERERRSYHSVVLWGHLASDAHDSLREGHAVLVEGRLTSRSYESAGAKRYEVEVVATRFVVLSGAESGAALDAA